jgi:hypothetical protein
MADETVASRALESGEKTSEHAVMTEASASGKLWAVAGMITAILPQILDMVNMLPEPLKQNKFVQIALLIIGAIATVLGVVKDTSAKVSYINGRSLLKASALRDVAPESTIKPSDTPNV